MRFVFAGLAGRYCRVRARSGLLLVRWVLVLTVTACFAARLGVAAQGQTRVRIEPPVAQVRIGESVTVQIVVADVQDLYGLDVRLAFDPLQVEVVDADPAEEHIQIESGDFVSPDFVARNQADNQAGTIWFAVVQLNPREPVSGTGVIASITFQGKAAGTRTLSFTYDLLCTRDGEPIEVVTQDGQIVVEGDVAASTLTPSPRPTGTEVPSPPADTPLAEETPPPAPTETAVLGATVTRAPTPTVMPVEATGTAVLPSDRATAALAATEPAATRTIAIEQATAQSATPAVTATREPAAVSAPTATFSTRQQAAVVTPTVEQRSRSEGESLPIVLYGLVFVGAVILVVWVRRAASAG